MSQTWKHERTAPAVRKGIIRRTKAVVQNEIEEGLNDYETETLYDAANNWTTQEEKDFEHELLCEALTAYILHGE